MKCPFCGHLQDKVIDSRISQEGGTIRRRRECLRCKERFTTYERIEEISFMVVKKDGRREPFDRNKLRIGIMKACEKRPISMEVIEETVDRIAHELKKKGKKEIASREIGELVVKNLRALDEVAYVRFASVYRQFKDISEFMDELRGLLKERKRRKALSKH